MENPKRYKEEICGKTPLNFVKVTNWAPTEVVIPSINLEMSTKGSSSLTGYVGTICPITMEVIATGVEQQYDFNYPMKMTTHFKNGKLAMVFANNENTKSSTQEIDLVSYVVRPFTTIKPIVYVDGLPLTAHKNTKTIHSEDKPKSLTMPYGESLGLDLKVKMNTDTNVIGPQGLMDYASLYNYNPINMFLFSWTGNYGWVTLPEFPFACEP